MRTKHFASIAAAFNLTRPEPLNDNARSTVWRTTLEQVTLALATTNPHFDKARFLKAAGVEA
jgi:hypothetical protein